MTTTKTTKRNRSAQSTSKKRAEDVIGTALKSGGAHLGDVIWCEMSGVRVERDALRSMLVQEGLPDSLAPDDPDPKAALGKAVGAYREKGRNRFLRRSEKRGQEVLVVKQDGKSFEPTATITVDPDTGAFQVSHHPAYQQGDETDAVVEEVRAEYNEHLRYAKSAEVGSMVVDVVLGWCGGIRLKGNGHVYWAPSMGGDEVRALKRVVDQLGQSYLTVFPVHETEEARAGLKRAAQASFEEELRKAHDEIAKFKEAGGARPSTLERRLEEFEDLKGKVELYGDILDKQKKKLLDGLKDAGTAVREMLAEADEDAA